MNRIVINGVTISGHGNVVVNNGRIMVGGKDVTPDAKDIRIEVHGDVEKVQADVCSSIVVHGSVKGNVQTQSGDIECGDVGGSVSTMSGDVDCHSVAGNASTMSGNIKSMRPR